MQITITETAATKISDILIEEKSKYIRAFVQGGGCSGFSYGFTIEEEKEDDDFIFDNVLVDSMSMQYLEGSTIDYEKKAFESNFKIINPNAKASCGCGSSFTI
jgi:iron-sulfur cluster insertion protein